MGKVKEIITRRRLRHKERMSERRKKRMKEE